MVGNENKSFLVLPNGVAEDSARAVLRYAIFLPIRTNVTTGLDQHSWPLAGQLLEFPLSTVANSFPARLRIGRV